MKTKEFKINGVVSEVVLNGQNEIMTEDEFQDLFLKWIEDNKWKFSGIVQQLK